MDQLTEFLVNHWELTLALVVLLCLIGWTFIQGMQGVQRVSPMDATRLISHEEGVVLDVRGDGEYREGHIINALHIPQGNLKDQVDKLEKYKDRPIIMTCRTGSRSGSAGAVLRKRGFERVYNLAGGILAWENANLPLTRK